jgi:hypothetical protein
LALASGLGTATINRYEFVDGVPTARRGKLEKIRKAFEAEGIRFIQTVQGRQGIVFEVVRKLNGMDHDAEITSEPDVPAPE